MTSNRCGFGVDGGECYSCELERKRANHQDGCIRRMAATGHCSCITANPETPRVPVCDYYDTREDAERLTHSEVLDALEEAIDNLHGSESEGTEADIREAWPESLTIYGWVRKKISDEEIDKMTKEAVDAVLNCFGDTLELGDPASDGEPVGLLPKGFEEVIRKDMAERHIWNCEQLYEIELTTDQVVELAKLKWPEWFENTTL